MRAVHYLPSPHRQGGDVLLLGGASMSETRRLTRQAFSYGAAHCPSSGECHDFSPRQRSAA